MRWKGRRISTNVEDRRGGGAKQAALVYWGLLLLCCMEVFGVDPNRLIRRPQAVTSAQSSQGSAPQSLTADQKEASDFVGTILADTEDTWTPIFQQLGMSYKPPRLVLFNGVVRSGCGTGSSCNGACFIVQQTKKSILIPHSLKKCARKWESLGTEPNRTFPSGSGG